MVERVVEGGDLLTGQGGEVGLALPPGRVLLPPPLAQRVERSPSAPVTASLSGTVASWVAWLVPLIVGAWAAQAGRRPIAVNRGAKTVRGTGAASTSWNARSQRRTSSSVATPAATIASRAAQDGGRIAAGGWPMK